MAVKTNGHGVAGTVTETPKISDGAVGEGSNVQPRRTFGQSLTHTLYSAPVLGGLATLALVGIAGIIYLTRGYNPPPREPTRIEQNNNQNPVAIPPVIDLSTPTPTVTITPVIETPTPTILPVITEPIVVECGSCTAEELERYSTRARESYRRVADAFGMTPDRQVSIVLSKDKQLFAFDREPNADDPVKYLVSWFDNSSEAVDHELVHQFEWDVLGNRNQFWYSEGLAQYIQRRGILPLDRPSMYGSLNEIFDRLSAGKDIWTEIPRSIDAHFVGTLYFTGLTRLGFTSETNREALRILRRLRPSPAARNWVTPQLINFAYASALDKEPQELVYLIDLLEPGISYNNYIK